MQCIIVRHNMLAIFFHVIVCPGGTTVKLYKSQASILSAASVQHKLVSLKHDGTDGTERRDISLIDSRLKLTSEHLLKRRTRSFTHASEQRASLQLNFYWCPIWPIQLLSRLFCLSHRRRDRRAVARVPSVWPSHLSRHVLD